ncbi:MAG: steryl acetyl hydrolase, partial [Tardiphaga sp.]|nr:steryl acetyl hydrolase [Tardiphaga sp.]
MKKFNPAMTLMAAVWLVTPALAQTSPPASATLAPRDVPARSFPVPATVSPQLQQIIAGPLRAGWNTPP